LKIDDVIGDSLKIKISPPANFWMINYLAVDYSENRAVEISEITAIAALDEAGRDVADLLAETDNLYHVMPEIGNSLELIFPAPDSSQNLGRTLILKASGYYDIHLEAKGEPKWAIIDRYFNQEGYAVQYAFREFLHWREETIRARER
jgi:hypothetical protein